jgi:parvulin-like peptidyl-prolyl isomerase
MAHAEISSTDLLDRELVSFSSGSWRVSDAMERMRGTTSRQQRRVKTAADLKEFIVGLAIRDITLRRAADEHLDQDTSVDGQIDRKTQEFILTRWKDSIQDTIGMNGWDEKLLRARYDARTSQYAFPDEINVAEILLRTQREADAIVHKLRSGANFGSLARVHSIRLWAAKQGGELGFGAKSLYGAIGDTLFNMKVGVVAGPLKVDPYFGIFKVLGKRDRRSKTFDEAKDEIVKEVSAAENVDAVRRAIDRLRSGASISTQEEKLASIAVN